MYLPRRKVLSLSLGAAAWSLASRFASADAPAPRTIHIMLGFAPGGVGDISSRLAGQALQQKLGRSVVIDYRLGAGGNLAAEATVKAPPDGDTLILVGPNSAINASLYKNLPFDFVRDIAMVAGIMQSPLVMVTNPSFGAKNLAEFMDYAKANPGKINMASAGTGSAPHLAGELLQMMAGVSIVHVPYRGDAPALADLMAGRAQFMFTNMASSIGFIRGGRLRPLAVTSAKEWAALPGIPPLASIVPGFEVSTWFGLGAPKATPAETVAALNEAVNASLAEPATASRIRELAAEPMIMSPSELDALIAADTARWAKAVKFSGATVE